MDLTLRRIVQLVIIDVYGKITKIKLSDKLKLYISNVSDDWKESIIEDMLQEIRQQKVDMADNLKRYGKTFQTEIFYILFERNRSRQC